MPEISTYESTLVDLAEINDVAVRAARETPLEPSPSLGDVKRNGDEFIEVCGPHWVLDRRYEIQEAKYENIIEEVRLEILYALLADGQLVEITISEQIKLSIGADWRNYDDGHELQPIGDDGVTSFDFERRYTSSGEANSRSGSCWGNRDRPWDRGILLQASKGAGLSQLLENIRSGQATQGDPTPETAETRASFIPETGKFHYSPEKREKAVADLSTKRKKEEARATAAESSKIRAEILERKAKNMWKLRNAGKFITYLCPGCFVMGFVKYFLSGSWLILHPYGWIALFIVSIIGYNAAGIASKRYRNASIDAAKLSRH